MIQQEEFDDNEYCWTANPIGAILVLEESDDSTRKADDLPVVALKKTKNQS